MIALSAVFGFLIPAVILLVMEPRSFGGFVKWFFGGAALCVASTTIAPTVAWMIVGEPGTRRRNGGLLGVLLGLGAGFGGIAVLVFTDWSLSNADEKMIACIAIVPLTTLVGFLVGYLIARGAHDVQRRSSPNGPRYTP